MSRGWGEILIFFAFGPLITLGAHYVNSGALSPEAFALGFPQGFLITGVIWGHKTWGVWWTWSPRLTFSLMLWLLYVVYLIIRPAIESPERRATISAVYAVAAFLDVPLVWLSVRLLPDIHPKSIEMTGPMKLTLIVWFVPVTLLCVGLIVTFYKSSCKRWARKQAQIDDSAWIVGDDQETGWQTPAEPIEDQG